MLGDGGVAENGRSVGFRLLPLTSGALRGDPDLVTRFPAVLPRQLGSARRGFGVRVRLLSDLLFGHGHWRLRSLLPHNDSGYPPPRQANATPLHPEGEGLRI